MNKNLSAAMENDEGTGSSSANNNNNNTMEFAEEFPADFASPPTGAALPKDVHQGKHVRLKHDKVPQTDGTGLARSAPEKPTLELAECHELPTRRTVTSAENGAAVAMESTYHDTPGAFSVHSGSVTAASQLPVEDSFSRYTDDETKNEDDAEIGETRTNIPNQSLVFVLEAEAINDSGVVATALPTISWHKRRCFWVAGAGFVVSVLAIVIIVILLRPGVNTTPSTPSVTPQPSTPTSVPPPESNLTPEQIACNFIARPSLSECRSTDSISKTTGSKIPSEIGLLTQLVSLDMYFNKLTGTIPSTIGKLTQLTWLSFYENDLVGSIPPSIGDLTKLKALGFFSNSLTGSIPSSFGNLTELDYLDLSNNGLTGSLPSSFGKLTKLTALGLKENDLTGSMPVSIRQLTQLLHFDVSANRFNGQFPLFIGSLTRMTSLGVYFNEFTGDIPSSIGNMTQMTYLDFSHNTFVGTIPQPFERLTLLTYLTFSDNEMTGSIPSFLASFTSLTGLLFDQNAFTGSIPSSICSILSGIKIDCGEVQCSCCIDGVTNTAC